MRTILLPKPDEMGLFESRCLATPKESGFRCVDCGELYGYEDTVTCTDLNGSNRPVTFCVDCLTHRHYSAEHMNLVRYGWRRIHGRNGNGARTGDLKEVWS